MSLRNRVINRTDKTPASKKVSAKFTIETASTIIQEIVNELKKKNLLKSEPYRFFLKENYDTACWSYRPPHYIMFGDNVFQYFIGKDEQKIEFFKMFVLHEIGHSLYTDYRLFKIVQILEEKDLPFNVFNLFEDARIEHALINDLNIKIIENFNWSKYIDLSTPYDLLDLFYWCIQKGGNENSFKSIYQVLNSDLKLDASKVWDFYIRATKAKDSFEIIDLVQEWMQIMKDKTLSIDSKLFYGEESILDSPDSIIAEIKGATEIASLSISELKNRQISTNDASTRENIFSIKRLSSQNLLADEIKREDFDKVFLNKITKEIERIFVDNRRYTKTSTPSKRLNLRNMILKNPNLYKKRKNQEIKKKKVTLILDISGSMTLVMDEMLILVEVYNILAKKGLIDGYLILSASFYTDEATYQTFKFPLDKNVLKRVVTYEVKEGLAEVMKHLTPLIKINDFVLVFTDGLLADDPLNKQFFKKHNINLYGVYLTGVSSFGYDLEQYFDNYIIEDTLEKIAFKMVEMLKS